MTSVVKDKEMVAGFALCSLLNLRVNSRLCCFSGNDVVDGGVVVLGCQNGRELFDVAFDSSFNPARCLIPATVHDGGRFVLLASKSGFRSHDDEWFSKFAKMIVLYEAAMCSNLFQDPHQIVLQSIFIPLSNSIKISKTR